jgi:hypothetical protein
MGDSSRFASSPRRRGPAALVPTTLDSLAAFAGTKGRGNDDIKNPGVKRFGNA